MPFTLESKAALVTGAGRGIGRAIVQKLAECGAAVMINDLDPGPAEQTAEIIRAAGGRAAVLAGDVTRPDFPNELVCATLQAFGQLDIIVNNAGYTWDSVIQKTSDEQFQAMLDIHVTAPFRILRAASEYIRAKAKQEAAEGRIVMRKVVNISSVNGIGGNAGQSGYSAGKAAIIGLTKTLSKEWGRYNVSVNAVAFGLISTRLTQRLHDPDAKIDIQGKSIDVGVPAGVLDNVNGIIPLGRAGTPEEAAGTVLFFCSPLSDYVSGEVLVCGGGMRA